MKSNTKRIALLLLVGSLISLIFLSSSLSNLELHSGTRVLGSGNSDNPLLTVESLSSVQTYIFPVLQGIIALVLLVLLIYLIVRLIVFVNFKIILWSVLVITILLIIVFLLPRTSLGGQSTILQSEFSELPTPPALTYPVTPLGEPPQILLWLMFTGIAFGLSLSAIKVIKQWLGKTQVEDKLLQEAENAVSALKTGTDLRNVILRCYMQMNRSLQEEQGVERNFTMTVREFERWLGFMGFPTVPVHQLTRLFEIARYGNGPMTDNDKETAFDSLNEIIQFCRTSRIQN
jgi:hypothetical protein